MQTRLFCFAPFGGNYAVHHQIDFALSLGVKLKGGSTATIGCDSLFHNCEAVMHSDEQAKMINCRNCSYNGRALLSLDILPFFTVNELVTPEEISEIENWSNSQLSENWKEASYLGYPLGHWSLSSVIVGFQINLSDIIIPRIQKFYQSMLRNTALTALAVNRVIDNFNPNVAVVFNGRFAVYRTAYEILRSRDIRVITHERGFSDSTFIIYENATILDGLPFFTILEPWQKVPLTINQLQRVKQYISGRETGKDTNLPSFASYTTEEVRVRQKLGVGSESLVGFFTSTEAEMALSEDINVANVQLPLLALTIDAMRNHKDKTLVIRHHPNLVGGPNHPPEYRFITGIYRALVDSPSNVRNIMPSEQVSSYSLMWNLDGAICPFSTVGVEVPARGNASFASQFTPYSIGQALTFDKLTSLDINKTLDSLVNLSKNFNVDILRKSYRFINTYINRLSTKFQSVNIKNFYEKDISPELIQDIQLNRDPNLTRILDGIMTGNTVYPMPTNDELALPADDETAFIQDEVNFIKSRKTSIQQESIKYLDQAQMVTNIIHSPRKSPYPVIFCERYHNLQRISLESNNSIEDTLSDLIQIVKNAKSEYLFYSHPQVSFDADFVLSGIEHISDQSLEKKMVLRGVWIGHLDGELYSEFLSKRLGETTYQSVIDHFTEKVDPLLLLSFGFYRKTFLLELLNSLSQVQSQKDQIELIIKYWNSSSSTVVKAQTGIVLQ